MTKMIFRANAQAKKAAPQRGQVPQMAEGKGIQA
jgi:hypothetical protein